MLYVELNLVKPKMSNIGVLQHEFKSIRVPLTGYLEEELNNIEDGTWTIRSANIIASPSFGS